MTLDDLKELDEFDLFKKYIMSFVVKNSDLTKLIYYPLSNPLEDERAIDLENPYLLFDENDSITMDGENITGSHGVLLFKQKNDKILNASIPVILVDFHSAKKRHFKEYNNIYIVFRIICKGEAVQELANGLNRSFVIAKLIDDEFVKASVNGLGEVERISFEQLSLNEENIGYVISFKASSFAYDFINNKNIQARIRGESL